MEYKEVQKIAKDTIEYAKKNIYAGMSLIEIREMCERKMLELGADSFWYFLNFLIFHNALFLYSFNCNL